MGPINNANTTESPPMFEVTVKAPNYAGGVVTYHAIVALKDLGDLVKALSTDDARINVLAENGLFALDQTITVTRA